MKRENAKGALRAAQGKPRLQLCSRTTLTCAVDKGNLALVGHL